jgi:hypothetical protein
LLARFELVDDRRGEFFVADAGASREDVVAEFGAGAGLGLVDELLGVGTDSEREDAAAGGDADERVGVALGQVAETRDALGLGNSDDVEQARDDRAITRGAQARQNFALEHRMKFAGRAGEAEDFGVSDLCVQARRCADGVGNAGRARGALGLAGLARRHFAVAFGEQGGDLGARCGIGYKLCAEDAGEGLAREVAVGGSEAAGHQDERGLGRGGFDRRGDDVDLIGHGDVLDGEDAAVHQLIGEVLRVGVEELARDDLVA